MNERRAIYELTREVPATQRQFAELQRRYKQLSENEKQRVN
jgi:hypothetical protein